MGPAVITHGHMEGKVQGVLSGPKGNRDRHLEVGLVNFFPDELFQSKFLRKIGYGSSSNNTWTHGGQSAGGGSCSQGEWKSALRSVVGELFPDELFQSKFRRKIWRGPAVLTNGHMEGQVQGGGGRWPQGESGPALRSGVGELFPGRTFSVEIPAKNRVWVQQ